MSAALDISERFRQRVRLSVKSYADSQALRTRVGQAARAELAALMASGRASPFHRRFVDGVPDAPEESVNLRGGTISYRFSMLALAAEFALNLAVSRSPVRKGSYRRGWFFMVDGTPWVAPLEQVPPGSELVLTNTRPYHRKIDVGGQVTSMPPGIVEAVRQEVKRRFPSLTVQRQFVLIPGGYILKGRAVRSGLSYNPKKKTWTQAHAPRGTNRADSKAGQPMTYPAVVMTEVAL